MLKLFVFKAKLPGQGLIIYPATGPMEAYERLMSDLHSFYPTQEQFLSIKKKINLFPVEMKELE